LYLGILQPDVNKGTLHYLEDVTYETKVEYMIFAPRLR